MMRPEIKLLGVAGLLACLLQSPARADGPAEAIAGKMADVTDELNKTLTGKPVQAEQKAIVNDLDELIASLEKKNQNGKGNMKRNDPRKGMDDSRITQGTGGIGTLVKPQEGGKDWGKLSGRERDRILQSMSEGFPPEYRTVLERYYRRLAEDKGTSKGEAAPGTAPAGDDKVKDDGKAKAEDVLMPATKS